jgi:hypothetical protein
MKETSLKFYRNGFILLIIILLILVVSFLLCLRLSNIYKKFFTDVRKRKVDYYNLALQKSIETGKPLFVIGDPESGSLFNRTIHKIIGIPYGYGDLCTDLTGCPKNPSGNSIKGKLEEILTESSFTDNSYVIYTSQLIEYIDNDKLDDVLLNLIRISGGDLYIVNMNYSNDSYTDSLGLFVRKNYIQKCPPEFDYIEYSNYNPLDQNNESLKRINL